MASDWVDFKAVKDAVSIEMALLRYGIHLRRISRDYLRGRCPLPTHQSQASNQSFIVNTAKNAWSCQSASCVAGRDGRLGGNVLDFVALMDGCPIREAALTLQRSSGGPLTTLRQKARAETAAFKFSGTPRCDPADDPTLPRPLSFTLSGIDHDHPYLNARGVLPQVARTFGIGYFVGKGSMRGRIIIPIHSLDGAVVGYAGRALDSREPRYKFPPGLRKSLLLYNLHRAVKVTGCRIVVIVEGFFDCVKVHQAGYRCVVALMGSTLSSQQLHLLQRHFDAAILMLDGDDPGRVATGALAVQLGARLPLRIASVPLGLQPDQMTDEEIRALLGEAHFD